MAAKNLEDSESMYRIAYAASGQSRCQDWDMCRSSIDKRDIVMGKLDKRSQHDFTRTVYNWYHWRCVKPLMLQGLTKCLDTVEQLQGFNELLDEDKVLVLQAWVVGEAQIEAAKGSRLKVPKSIKPELSEPWTEDEDEGEVIDLDSLMVYSHSKNTTKRVREGDNGESSQRKAPRLHK
ncbi:hypothetical protein K439DRAFT_1635754 [Ramaria rubella]|nr:hypothetical protein K439DRAFT_1635754 [Ramaria rubella]